MNIVRVFNFLAQAVCFGLTLVSVQASAEDIDIFLGSSGGKADAANVLIVLDNTSNWSAVNQGWPDGITQGQAEVNALNKVVASLKGNTNINLGLMLLNTKPGGGSFMVFGIQPMTDANISAWQTWANARYANITDSSWKAASDANYGSVMFDAYKYFGGYTSPAHATDNVAGTPVNQTHFGTAHFNSNLDTDIIDKSVYSADFRNFLPPSVTSCASNYVIFIGNGFPNQDDINLLSNVGGNTAAFIPPSDPPPTPVDGGSRVYTADEWARFLFMTDVSATAGQQNVKTYTLNVFGPKAGPTQPKQAQYLQNMASAGGGSAWTAQNAQQILDALKKILAQILGTNSTFASASLPVNTTNRAQDKNQVFIPMFRPDKKAQPRWMGNLKQYQLISTKAGVQLGDARDPSQAAVNTDTGFPLDCAISIWTSDSIIGQDVTGKDVGYWQNVIEDPSPKGLCTDPGVNPYSDAPDGPIVEKGGVAEVIRKGNNPPTTTSTPSWAVNRTVKTLSGATLTDFNVASSGLSAAVVNFVLGYDLNDENHNGDITDTRPSLHGDSIHSRPLPIDYGALGVTTYYGSNDGMLRAIDSATTSGKERWAFIAPEFFGSLSRLMDNLPLINYPGMSTAGIDPAPIPKDYYFDGSIGLYQNKDNSKVWIYPTMRRGGRMIYAFDVTDPAAPKYKWKAGCPHQGDDSGCTSGFEGIGQTWSLPNAAATVQGYSGPVLVVGGGYDKCEDANTATPACSNPKGAGVYVIDAFTGAVIKSFETKSIKGITAPRSVIADVALVAVATAGIVDHAYAVDLGGNIYRIDFGDSTSNWRMTRVAYTNGSGRKFFYPPALLPAPGNKVYLALGSGDREHPLQSQYPYSSVTNRFYVYLDDLNDASVTDLDAASLMNDFTGSTSCTSAGILPTSNLKGWFMDLNQNGTGEQTVTSAVIVAGMVTFSTNRPIPPDQGTCATSLGKAYGYWLNLFNGSGAIGVSGTCDGTRSAEFVGGGLPPSPVLGIVPVDGKPTSVIIGAVQRGSGASTAISPQRIDPAIIMKRKTIYWKSSGQN
ncbi:MAG: hypothetical protein HYZ65_07060 [Burkholderiales bacterium]|nr:hypothetical protein [Burkholderiales bacterium]